MKLAKSNQREYFSLSGIRLISDLPFSQWEDQNEADSRVISYILTKNKEDKDYGKEVIYHECRL